MSAAVHLGGDIRRGVAELDGKGEVVGGIVVMRYGENALNVIDGVKTQDRRASNRRCRPGCEVVPTYDRSELIKRFHRTLREKLIEEMHRRRAGLPRFPLAPPLRAGRDRHAADRDPRCRSSRCATRHLTAQHHVARRHRDRDRRDGRCGHHHGRERAQSSGTLSGKSTAANRTTANASR